MSDSPPRRRDDGLAGGGAISPPAGGGGRLLRLDRAADARREARALALGIQRLAGRLLASGLAPAQREQAETLRTLADSFLLVVDEALATASPELPDAGPGGGEERPPESPDETLAAGDPDERGVQEEGLADGLDEHHHADGLDERLAALERLGAATGEDVCRQVIEDFLRLGGEDLARMRRALDRRDGADLAAAARSLAGSAGILGAAGLATDCARLEVAAARLAEPEGPAACASRLERVERGYRALADRLAARLAV